MVFGKRGTLEAVRATDSAAMLGLDVTAVDNDSLVFSSRQS